jgi:hypothetical protein
MDQQAFAVVIAKPEVICGLVDFTQSWSEPGFIG